MKKIILAILIMFFVVDVLPTNVFAGTRYYEYANSAEENRIIIIFKENQIFVDDVSKLEEIDYLQYLSDSTEELLSKVYGDFEAIFIGGEKEATKSALNYIIQSLPKNYINMKDKEFNVNEKVISCSDNTDIWLFVYDTGKGNFHLQITTNPEDVTGKDAIAIFVGSIKDVLEGFIKYYINPLYTETNSVVVPTEQVTDTSSSEPTPTSRTIMTPDPTLEVTPEPVVTEEVEEVVEVIEEVIIPTGILKLIVFDDYQEPLKNVKFKIYNESGEVIRTVTTDKNGVVEITDLEYGTYQYMNVEVPIGYELNSEKYTFTIDEENIEVVNTRYLEFVEEIVKEKQYDSGIILLIIFAIFAVVSFAMMNFAKRKRK